jgi:hypothetical protein
MEATEFRLRRKFDSVINLLLAGGDVTLPITAHDRSGVWKLQCKVYVLYEAKYVIPCVDNLVEHFRIRIFVISHRRIFGDDAPSFP